MVMVLMVVSSFKGLGKFVLLYDLNKAEGVPNLIIAGRLIFMLMIINKILTQFLVWCRGLQGLSGWKIVGKNRIKKENRFYLTNFFVVCRIDHSNSTATIG
jgi:hypothetical protein